MSLVIRVLSVFFLCSPISAIAENLLKDRVLKKSQGLATPTPKPSKYFPETWAAIPHWKNYLLNINTYQKAFPGIYLPLDLVRWDKLPIEWLKTHVRKHGLAWERSEARPMNFDDRRGERVMLSRNANQELFEAFKDLEKKGVLWVGSTRAFLDSVSSDDRLSLTPLDEAFQQSELGGALYQRLREKRSDIASGFFIDVANKRIILELGETSYMKIEFDDSAPEELRVRSTLGKNERLGADIRMRKENFRGYLLNSQSNEKLPLGPYPRQTQRWVDERGTSHFQGDGHKH